MFRESIEPPMASTARCQSDALRADRIRFLVYEVTRRGVSAMPTYEYRCEKCRKRFSRVETISQHGKKRPKCPKCGSAKVMQVFSSFFAKTGKKS